MLNYLYAWLAQVHTQPIGILCIVFNQLLQSSAINCKFISFKFEPIWVNLHASFTWMLCDVQWRIHPRPIDGFGNVWPCLRHVLQFSLNWKKFQNFIQFNKKNQKIFVKFQHEVCRILFTWKWIVIVSTFWVTNQKSSMIILWKK